MKKYLLIICVLIAIPAWAQEQTDPLDIKYDQWEAGMDLIWIVKQYQTPSIFLRKNMLRQKQNGFGYRKTGWRIRFGFDTRNKIALKIDTSKIIQRNRLENQSNSFFLRTGYEWNQKFNSLQLYYGADVFGHYYQFRAGYYYYYKNDGTDGTDSNGNYIHDQYDHIGRSFQLGISPIAGLKYYITKHVLASAEARIDISYSWEKSRNTYYYSTARYIDDHPFRTQYVNARFVPVSTIAISYLF